MEVKPRNQPAGLPATSNSYHPLSASATAWKRYRAQGEASARARASSGPASGQRRWSSSAKPAPGNSSDAAPNHLARWSSMFVMRRAESNKARPPSRGRAGLATEGDVGASLSTSAAPWRARAPPGTPVLMVACFCTRVLRTIIGQTVGYLSRKALPKASLLSGRKPRGRRFRT